jgi:hypothetical protein
MMLLTIAALAVSQAGAPAAKPVDDPMICKSRIPTGTRFAKKTCRKQSEMDAQAERDRAALAEQQMMPKINPPGGPDT